MGYGPSFSLMISGLFIVGLGFSLQQTAANPLAIVMGDPSKGSQRLSLAGGINNLGTTIGPILISFAIFGSLSKNESNIEEYCFFKLIRITLMQSRRAADFL